MSELELRAAYAQLRLKARRIWAHKTPTIKDVEVVLEEAYKLGAKHERERIIERLLGESLADTTKEEKTE